MLRPDRAKGRPGIYGGIAPDGNAVLIKVWPRIKGLDDQDLEEIWRHELRQLHRLGGYPGTSDSIAQLYDAGLDSHGFYLVLATGQRRPLQSILDSASPGHWLKQPQSAANRARIWRNLALLARGVETLHAQGLLHRNIDTWAVLTAGIDDPDFQLTGFEWSMRLTGPQLLKPTFRKARGPEQDSFLRDWLMYSMLASNLLGAKSERFIDASIAAHLVADHLSANEVILLRDIGQIQPRLPINGEIVTARIRSIVSTLGSEIAYKSPKLHVALRLGRDTPLADRIRQASDNEIESDDLEGQIAFVTADISESPLLIGVHAPERTDGIRLLLRGRHLYYRLQEFRPPKSTNTTWDFAFCDGAETSAPAPVNFVGTSLLDPTFIELMPFAIANERFARMRGKLTSWRERLAEFKEGELSLTPHQVALKSLSLLQLLETLYAAASVFPVKVLPTRAVEIEGEYAVCVAPRVEVGRDQLSKALRLKPQSQRLREALIGDRVKPEGWILTDSRYLGAKSSTDTEWRFRDVERVEAQPDTYVFTGSKPAIHHQEAYLIPEGFVGQDAQFRRRLKALKALADHEELISMIVDPRRRIIESHDKLTEDEAFRELDEPKQKAIREIVASLPLYLLQGPPGVGKTRLVRDLVHRRFQDEPTTRLLLTAQSNAAIDHLMDELESVLDLDSPESPLVVRCRSKDFHRSPGPFDIRLQSAQLVRRLSNSALSKQLPTKLATALAVLASSIPVDYEAEDFDDSAAESGRLARLPAVQGRAVSHALRAFEGAVARAANVVFATTNSAELERLIEERAQCDWTIVEEAAKATGTELISPMLLSHRRLMIGDHKQLPPFASDQMTALLRDPDAVKEALTAGREYIGRTLLDPASNEILDEIENDLEEDAAQNRALPRLCAESLRLITFFESTIEAEFVRKSRDRRGRSIAARLTEQHRMHPEIAALVSRCFYSEELTTHAECSKKFALSPRPFQSKIPDVLPLTPIVIVDMPYVQSTIGPSHGEKHPRWHNPSEVNAVKAILRILAPLTSAATPPTLAVLSPYSQQVRRLTEATHDIEMSLKFERASLGGPLCHTVDSFQGSEADLIIVSLVRNNQHSNIQNALGFLTDTRRMNVLFSRARWQLMLVASLAFLKEIVRAARNEDELRVGFLRALLETLAEGHDRGVVTIVPYGRLQQYAR